MKKPLLIIGIIFALLLIALIAIPFLYKDNIEFTIQSAFQAVRFGNLNLQNVNGLLMLNDKALHLMDLRMNLLGGSLVANGSYSTPKNLPPHSFFSLIVKNFGFRDAFESFVTVQKFAPISKSLNGTFGANLEIVSDLDSTLTPFWQTLNARGSLSINKATVEDFQPLNMAADFLKMEKLKKLVVEKIEPSIRIRDGRLHLAPLNLKYEGYDFLVSGSNGIDQSLDYTAKLIVPAMQLNEQANAAVNNLFKKKLDLLQDDSVILNLLFSGFLTKPDFKAAPDNVVKSATTRAKDIAQQEYMEKKVVLEDKVRAEIQKQKEELEQLKKEAEVRAKIEAERLKQEAANKLKSLIKKKNIP